MCEPLISGAAETLKRSLGTFVTRIRRIVRNSIVCRELIFLTLKVVVRWTAKWVVPKAGRYQRATLLVTHYGDLCRTWWPILFLYCPSVGWRCCWFPLPGTVPSCGLTLSSPKTRTTHLTETTFKERTARMHIQGSKAAEGPRWQLVRNHESM